MHVNDKEISAYLDDSLPKDRQNTLKQHFSVCGECRRKLNEWDELFDAIGMLDFDFSLEGLEQKVLSKIKNAAPQAVPPRVLITQMAYVLLTLFVAGLFVSPMTRMAGHTLQKAGSFLFDAGLRFVNEFKWHAMDVISFVQSLNLSSWVFPLIAGVTLIAGGSYFSFGGKLRKA